MSPSCVSRQRSSPLTYADHREHTKYIHIRRSEKTESGYTVSIREDAVKSALETAGWVVIISNDIDNAKEAMRIYRGKDVVESVSFGCR